MISLTTAQHITQDKAEKTEVQQGIRDYHMALKSVVVTEEVILDIDGMDALINEEFPSQEGEAIWEDPCQVLPDSPEMNEVFYQYFFEKAVDAYDQFIGSEVCLPG